MDTAIDVDKEIKQEDQAHIKNDQVATHSRHLCVQHPFEKTPHENYCNLCHCYVCEVAAPCGSWSGAGGHCHARNTEVWDVQRISLKMGLCRAMKEDEATEDCFNLDFNIEEVLLNYSKKGVYDSPDDIAQLRDLLADKGQESTE